MDTPQKTPTTIVPLLSVSDGIAAVEFYKAAFGATELMVAKLPGNKVIAELAIEGAKFMVADETPKELGPRSLGGTTVRLNLIVADPDAVARRAVIAGATLMFPVTNQPYGLRQGRVVDPFGHHWMIGRPLTPDEQRD